MKKNAVYEKTREVYTFVGLMDGADILIKNAEHQLEGNFFKTMNALLLTAFTFEAYLNHLGDKTFIFWKEIETVKVLDKYVIICKILRFNT